MHTLHIRKIKNDPYGSFFILGETDMFGYILISIFGKVTARVNEDKKYVKEVMFMDKDEVGNLFQYKIQSNKENGCLFNMSIDELH